MVVAMMFSLSKIFAYWFKLNKKLRFLLVGGGNTVLSFLIFIIGISCFQWNYQVVLIITYLLSVNFSILSMRSLVFEGKGNWAKEYAKAAFVYLSLLLLNYAFLFLFIDLFAWNEIVAQFLYTLLATISTFVLHNKFSFSSAKK